MAFLAASASEARRQVLNSIGNPIHFASGQFQGHTIRTELVEVQKANLGRKYAKVDRRPLDPPPVVLMKLFEIFNPGTDQEYEQEIPDYEKIDSLGLLCNVDLFPVPDDTAPPPLPDPAAILASQTALPASATTAAATTGAWSQQQQQQQPQQSQQPPSSSSSAAYDPYPASAGAGKSHSSSSSLYRASYDPSNPYGGSGGNNTNNYGAPPPSQHYQTQYMQYPSSSSSSVPNAPPPPSAPSSSSSSAMGSSMMISSTGGGSGAIAGGRVPSSYGSNAPPPPPPPSAPGVQLPSVSTLLRPSEYQSHHHHHPHHHHGHSQSYGNNPMPFPPASDIVTHMNGRPVYESSKCTSALVGSMFVQPATIDYQGRKALLFPFADLAVGMEGSFFLRYRVFDIFSRVADTEDLVVQAECYGQPFRVYSTKEFPGLEASTELTKTLAAWGVRLNLRQAPRKRRKKSEMPGHGQRTFRSDLDDEDEERYHSQEHDHYSATPPPPPPTGGSNLDYDSPTGGSTGSGGGGGGGGGGYSNKGKGPAAAGGGKRKRFPLDQQQQSHSMISMDEGSAGYAYYSDEDHLV